MMKKFNSLLILLVAGTMAACSSIDLSDLATTAGATAGAVVGSALGVPPVGTATLTITGGVLGGAAVTDAPSVTDICKLVPEDERQACVSRQRLLELIETWGMYAIIGGVAAFLLAFLSGYYTPNGQHRKLRRRAFDDPNMKSDDM